MDDSIIVAAAFSPRSKQAWKDLFPDGQDRQAWRRLFPSSVDAHGWRTTGLGPAESKDWSRLGVEPSEAARWSAANMEPAKSRPWVDTGFDADTASEWFHASFNPDSSLKWMSERFTLLTARAWRDVGFSDPTFAATWRDEGFSASDAALWLLWGVGDANVAASAARDGRSPADVWADTPHDPPGPDGGMVTRALSRHRVFGLPDGVGVGCWVELSAKFRGGKGLILDHYRHADGPLTAAKSVAGSMRGGRGNAFVVAWYDRGELRPVIVTAGCIRRRVQPPPEGLPVGSAVWGGFLPLGVPWRYAVRYDNAINDRLVRSADGFDLGDEWKTSLHSFQPVACLTSKQGVVYAADTLADIAAAADDADVYRDLGFDPWWLQLICRHSSKPVRWGSVGKPATAEGAHSPWVRVVSAAVAWSQSGISRENAERLCAHGWLEPPEGWADGDPDPEPRTTTTVTQPEPREPMMVDLWALCSQADLWDHHRIAGDVSRSPGFPPPVRVLGGQPVWLRDHVEKWLADNGLALT